MKYFVRISTGLHHSLTLTGSLTDEVRSKYGRNIS